MNIKVNHDCTLHWHCEKNKLIFFVKRKASEVLCSNISALALYKVIFFSSKTGPSSSKKIILDKKNVNAWKINDPISDA
jgi:hypothetical protein